MYLYIHILFLEVLPVLPQCFLLDAGGPLPSVSLRFFSSDLVQVEEEDEGNDDKAEGEGLKNRSTSTGV